MDSKRRNGMTQEILYMVRNKRFIELSEYLQNENSVDIAKSIIDLEIKTLIKVFRILPKYVACEVFSYLDADTKQRIVESITDDEIKDIVETLFLDDAVDFIEELPASLVKRILKNTSTEKRQLINKFLKYEEESAGSIMTIELIDLKEEMTVKESIDYIRKNGFNKETIDTCFVINRYRKLKGVVSIKDLIISNEDILIKDIMDKNIITVKTSEDQEKIAHLFKEYDLLSMAVIDGEDRLVGVITIDDVVDIIDQENTEDFHKMAAIQPNEEQYLKTSVLKLAKGRITWLLVLMISASLTGSIIQKFDDILQSVVILAAFIPMLMDTGGNSGSQSATLVIRGMALGEIQIKDYLKVMWKEFRVSLIVASILSVFNFIRIYFIVKTDLMISITVCISLFFTIVSAKVVGGTLPIVAKKLKFDPAIMASPFITTIVDTFSLIVYFTLAKMFLGIQ